ncbi:11438_t:CDS:2, partial [Scutellospora calospora]
MTFSKHIRWTIVEKHLEGVTVRAIARHLALSGRLWLLNLDDIKHFKTLLNEKPDWYLYELQSEIEFWLGYKISLSTIWR